MGKLKGSSTVSRKEARKAHKLAAKEKKQQRHARHATQQVDAMMALTATLSTVCTGTDTTLAFLLQCRCVVESNPIVSHSYGLQLLLKVLCIYEIATNTIFGTHNRMLRPLAVL